MVKNYTLTIEYLGLMKDLTNIAISDFNISRLFDYVKPMYRADLDEQYSSPMVVIGVYIAVASLWCVFTMGADLIHGFRSKKLWFPCKHFTINALSLTVIGVAMKLPVDLSGPMPRVVDQVGKLGSMAFMCTMVANLLPSLADMDRSALLGNIMALGVLVVTLAVNIFIQIGTGVIVKYGNDIDDPLKPLSSRGNGTEELRLVADQIIGNLSSPEELRVIGSLSYTYIAKIYASLSLVLLLIIVSSSLASLKFKRIIERKYQQGHERASKEVPPSKTGHFLTVEELKKYVSNHWIMAGSGSPQFMLVCYPTTTASGVICLFTFAGHALTIWYLIRYRHLGNGDSDYEWSMIVILIVQSIGVLVGTVAAVARWIASIRFKGQGESFRDDIKCVFKVGKHWTQKSYKWKYGYISLPFRRHKLKVVIKWLKTVILYLCIIVRCVVLVVCMILDLFYADLFRSMVRTDCKYVLQIENEYELAERTPKALSKVLDRLIQNGEEKQPKNLMKLIEKSTNGFKGIRKYDNNDHQDCWSLPVVTLTTIVVTLSKIKKIKKKEVKRLLASVREGLEYITLVEKSLNATDDYVSIRKAAAMLWEEVDLRHKWLGIKLKDISSQVNKTTSQVDTTLQIVKLLFEIAKNKITEGEGSSDDEPNFTSICANSMSRVTETIIGDEESHERLFDELSTRIADIMAACLTNLPQAIAKKCHTNVIEKREASVEAAAKLLGETKEIINTLQGPLQYKWDAYLSMSTEDLQRIDKWRAHLSEP